MAEVLDVSTDDDGEVTQFLVLDGGQPDTKLATPENMLLYDPLDELDAIDGGLDEFLDAEYSLKLSEDPEIVVGRSGSDYQYVLSVDGTVVETTPEQAEDCLQGVYETLADGTTAELERLFDRIMSDQVRRGLVNALRPIFTDHSRIEVTDSGWLIDEFYLVDWNANMYAANDDRESGDRVVSGSNVVERDTTYEFVQLDGVGIDADDEDRVKVGGEEYRLTERELLFLAKVNWLLDRRYYHPDEAFWDYADRWATRPSEEPDLDSFEL